MANRTWRTLLLWAALCGAAHSDTLKGELRVSRRGESVKVDLSALRDLYGVRRASDVQVSYTVAGELKTEKAVLAEAKQYLLGAEDWTFEIRDVRSSDDRMSLLAGQNTIAMEFGDTRIEIAVLAVERRCLATRVYVARRDDVVQVCWCDTGEGEWMLDEAKAFRRDAKQDAPNVNGHRLEPLSKLLAAEKSCVLLARGRRLAAVDPWVETAEKHYRAICADDWETFTSTLSAIDRKQAESRGSTAQTYWESGRRMVEKSGVTAYRFDRVDDRNSDAKRKRLVFRRVKGDADGGDCPITLVLEDGAWVVESATQ